MESATRLVKVGLRAFDLVVTRRKCQTVNVWIWSSYYTRSLLTAYCVAEGTKASIGFG